MRTLFLVALCVFLMAISSPLWAQDQNQEIISGLDKSTGLVKAGKYSEAISELKFAIGQLQELVMAGSIEEMKQVFSPWKANVRESS
ncbi:hypothetical protein GWO43_20970 [candidate division KSB1 bacterium]|nr:hypothetical protein [candidate division KSB1 bacterium]NIR70268.1 hypothetical protein [candidate division KSB1 bacterium]NIS26538.1 hypothetical protein [candidate division KSB1 bacterium]NIT73301.1 hypothetical protein [candidate division KSB1 bacterium]NIU23924.1 hypothetical protein [candidate division KSB1 bacterium]